MGGFAHEAMLFLVPLREFQDGLAFIRTKRDPTPENIGAIRDALAAHCARTGCVDVSRLVYAAHLGLVEEAYRTAEIACLGPRGTEDDIMGPETRELDAAVAIDDTTFRRAGRETCAAFVRHADLAIRGRAQPETVQDDADPGTASRVEAARRAHGD